MQIKSTLNEQQIKELFAEHAILVRTMEKQEIFAVPIYKIIELFGLELGEWTEKEIGLKPEGGVGILSGTLLSVKNPYTAEIIYFIAQYAFKTIAAEHNARKLCSIMAHSEAAQQWGAIWDARCARLDDVDKPHKSKARKAKQDAAGQEANT